MVNDSVLQCNVFIIEAEIKLAIFFIRTVHPLIFIFQTHFMVMIVFIKMGSICEWQEKNAS